MKDIYPPRMDLDFVLARADGSRLSGSCQLVDRAYLMNATPLGSDPLRYEKAMLDGWVDVELQADPARPPRATWAKCHTSRE